MAVAELQHTAMLKNDQRAVRFLMAGSVDDGKSTLTGRLLYDCQAILADQMGKLEAKAAGEKIDLSLLTDGLEAEREQGITIDVAYRYFSTRQRKFIIADAPGHEQYTRNMVTAAAGSDAAVILVDATKIDISRHPIELLPQTCRHSLLVNLLRVPHIVFAVNKIDAVANPQDAFNAIQAALLEFAHSANIAVDCVIPVSALNGDNVTVTGSLPWYNGPSLLDVLERMPVDDDANTTDAFLMPVQYVARDCDGANSTRVLWGRLARGTIRAGDAVQIFPSNESAIVREVRYAGSVAEDVAAPYSAGVVLDRHVDVTRGSWLSQPHTVNSVQQFGATLAWMDIEPAHVGRKYVMRHGNLWLQGRIVSVESRIDINTLEEHKASSLAVNEIGRVIIETQHAIPVTPYEINRVAGSLIMVDPSTHHTSGVLLVAGTGRHLTGVERDARSSPRVDMHLPIIVQKAECAPCFARAANISTGGLLMSASEVYAIGDALEVRFVSMAPESQGREIQVSGKIVDHRVDADSLYHYHVAFFDMRQEAFEKIAGTVEALSQRS